MASEMRFGEVRKLLESKGYTLHRIHSSHFIFVKPGVPHMSVPVHHGKVKPSYVRKIQKLP
jgi:predicted RNA binding protein YcfA (HicA-like mRNA interferase family)